MSGKFDPWIAVFCFAVFALWGGVEVLSGDATNIQRTEPHDVAELLDLDGVLGKNIFVSFGCLACHRASGFGGDAGPSLKTGLNLSGEPLSQVLAAVEGHDGYVRLAQQEAFGGYRDLDGDDMRALTAFLRSSKLRRSIAIWEIPPSILRLIDKNRRASAE